MTAFGTPTMILAAGLGTRLRPMTDVCAKALVPVGDRPQLASVIDRVAPLGGPIVVNAHHRANDLRAFLDAGFPDVRLSAEAELLGTAGGVRRASGLLGAAGPVVIWNGDLVTDLDLRALVNAHASAPDHAATLAVRPRARGQGNVGLDDHGRIVRLRDRHAHGAPDETRGGEFVPVHVLGGELRASLPEQGCLVGDVYLPALSRGAVLGAFVHDAPFVDIGSPRAYLDANLAWLAGRDADHDAGHKQWVGPGARVAEGVSLERTVVGAGAEVVGVGTLARCVVWPGARAAAPLADAVVLSTGLVVRVTPHAPC